MGVAKLTDQNTIVPESKYARVERERRYLLRDLPEGVMRADPHLQITDNYITGSRLRIRKVRDPHTNKWTVKFTQPPFAVADVTNVPLFTGGKLCELTFANVRAEITRSGLIR